jgi:hypothetical protein
MRTSFLTLTFICFLLASPAESTLVGLDLYGLGDQLTTLDTLSGLEWIDLTQTTNLSYNDVRDGIGNTWIAQGWRYANTAEVCGLFSNHAGHFGPCPTFDDSEATAPGQIDELLSLFGTTTSGGHASGIYDAMSTDPGTTGQTWILAPGYNGYVYGATRVEPQNGIATWGASPGIRELACAGISHPRTLHRPPDGLGLVGLGTWRRP